MKYNFFRRTLLTHGMFHQVRVDCGREFYLLLGMQEHLQDLRSRTDIASYRQTQSKQVAD